MENSSYHMEWEDFRQYGYRLIDWIIDYHRSIENRPVLSQVKPGEIRSMLPKYPPQKGESFEKIIQDIDSTILPGITHWQSPNFFAYFPANSSGPSILGELLSAALGVQGMLWSTSPACTELETHILDWLVDMLELPKKFKSTETGGGVIQDTASSATLCALLAGRERATQSKSNKNGCDGRLVAYASNQAHSSIEKAVKIAGIGKDNLHLIDVDDQFAMNPELLRREIEKDRADGKIPCFVCANVGSTSSNAFDPLDKIGKICEEFNIWFHVDAAMSGTAALCPEYRFIHKGIEYADSYCFNPHKWMFTNFDCDVFFVANRQQLLNTLSLLPEYLRNEASESGQVIDYRDWHIQLGRRFRSLKLWFVIRHYGIEGLQYHIRQHIKLAQECAQWIHSHKSFRLVVQPQLNLICFQHVAGDDAALQLMHKVNSSGQIFISHTKLNEKIVLRFCVGQTYTERNHVEKAWNLIMEIEKSI